MRHAAASASSATPVECSRSHGDLSPVSAAIATECRVDPLARDLVLRQRLDLDRLLPHPRLVQPCDEVVEARQRELGEPGSYAAPVRCSTTLRASPAPRQ